MKWNVKQDRYEPKEKIPWFFIEFNTFSRRKDATSVFIRISEDYGFIPLLSLKELQDAVNAAVKQLEYNKRHNKRIK